MVKEGQFWRFLRYKSSNALINRPERVRYQGLKRVTHFY
ncbi:hypothetical protein J610_1042 [Acinetobacter sp. 723929]|nr:hypothetical protein ACINWC136_3322 [Acinetobacter pittii]EXA91784.1 hypothetical protein J508_0414 [Acinetobacter sp. 1289694]EXB76411.1 hypothetical protein J551_2497 [Acinetobacter sp. 1475718]EXG32854.1 hypothetical protein J733_0710 [Acinetobacter sp. 263903-2]EXI18158.1 hypothetical protein J610_1042 [Acinetobacter sp. 723929]EXS01529.1 hypothetical protein J687_1231 [Acinetobacter sp. 225588]EYT43841.1 hypothetical protein J619_03766 [Acinetobacter sp. 478810]KCX96230.1 hypothetica